MKRKLMAAGAVAVLGMTLAQGAAAANVYWSVGVQGPGVVTTVGNHVPAPRVIVAPQPVYEPAPVYYMPPPPRRILYAPPPPPVVVFPGYGWGDGPRHRHWREHERHGHGQFDAHGGRWDNDRDGRYDRRDEYGDPWRR